MYQKPQVREVQASKVESEREVTGSEADALLKKYGYGQSSSNTIKEKPNTKMTFKELIELEESKQKQKKEKKPATFKPNNGYYSEKKYETDAESGYGFTIEIKSDMKIPKY